MIIKLENKFIKLEKCIYSDGTHSNDGVDVYFYEGKLIAVEWSKWQSTTPPEPYLISLNDFKNYPHPERVYEACKTIGIELL